MRPLVYVIAPYAAPTVQEIELNVSRAVAVGRLAAERGFVPIVPHALGWLGVHGAADESDPEVRPRALDCGLSLARLAGSLGADLWVVARGDRSLSSGTAGELKAYRDHGGMSVSLYTWFEWQALGAVDLALPQKPDDDSTEQLRVLNDEVRRYRDLVEDLRRRLGSA